MINEEFSFKRFIALFVCVSVGLALIFTEITLYSLKDYYAHYYSSFSWQNLDELGWTRANTFFVNYVITLFVGLAMAVPFSFHCKKEAVTYVV